MPLPSLNDLISEVLEDLKKGPPEQCKCARPVRVHSPDRMYWCECWNCGKAVAYTEVMEGWALISRGLSS